MSVYDKELIIDGKAVRSPEQQVYKNMKDIEELQQYIKEAYSCTGELNTASISVAKSLTNAGEDVEEGWLYDSVGNLFKITGGDEDNLLIQFYTSFRGPQGETGPSGADDIDDLTTANNKVWSSNKVNTEVGKAKDKGIYFTTTQPTEDSGLYYLNEGHFENTSYDIPIKAFDLLIYIDGDDKASEIYKVLSKIGDNWSLEKLGDIGGGKQLYQHNIFVYRNAGNETAKVNLQITNDNPNKMTLQEIITYIKDVAKKTHPADNGYADNLYVASGGASDIGYQQFGSICGVYVYTNNGNSYLIGVYKGGNNANYYYMYITGYDNIDDVVPL